MSLSKLVLDPDLAVSKERLYQDYAQDCEFVLEEREDVA
jgi:hypothetical protein